MNREKRALEWLNGRLSFRQARRLWRAVRKNSAIKKALDELLTLEGMLGPESGPKAISHFEMTRLEQYVMAEVEHATVSEARWWLTKPVLAVTVVAVALLISLPIWWFQKSVNDRATTFEFTPRGEEMPYETHLFLFCVTDDEAETRFHRLDRPTTLPGRADTCDINAEIQFALTNLTDVYPFIYVFGIDQTGRRLWYFPKPRDGGSIPIPTGVREQVWQNSIRLAVNHRPGDVWIHAIFSAAPLSEDLIETALDDVRNPTRAAALSLDLPGIYQERFPIHITNQGDAP